MSSAHRIAQDMLRACSAEAFRLNDPGDAGTIRADSSPCLVNIVTAAAETRTLADPTAAGQELLLVMITDGGDCTITADSAIDKEGNTSIVLDDVDDSICFYSIEDGSDTFAWRVKASDGVGASSIDLNDNVPLIFGTGDDLKLQYNGTFLEAGQTGFYSGMPSKADPAYDQLVHEFFDDFKNPASATASDYHAYTANNDGMSGTNAFQDLTAGVYNVVTAAADNDYHAMSSVSESWLFEAAKELWFLARFRLAEANTNESAWWFGLTDTLTTGGFQANALGPLASYDGALVWKDEGTMAVDFETSNACSQNTTTNMATFVTNTWTTVGFHFDGTATTSVVTPYYNVGGGTALTAGTAQNITLAGLAEMHAVFGVKAGPMGSAETLQVDFVKCLQLR